MSTTHSIILNLIRTSWVGASLVGKSSDFYGAVTNAYSFGLGYGLIGTSFDGAEGSYSDGTVSDADSPFGDLVIAGLDGAVADFSFLIRRGLLGISDGDLWWWRLLL